MTARLRSALLILTLAACAPRAPEPAPPAPQAPVQAIVAGEVYQVLDVGNAADVTLSLGDASCNPVKAIGRTIASAEGKFELPVVNVEAGERCVIAEAAGGGARGRATTRIAFAPSAEPARVTMVIRMDPPPPLTRQDADALVAALRSAVNDGSEPAMHTLASHVIAQDPDSIRAGLDHIRTHLGTIASVELTEERHEERFDEYAYEVIGTNGARTTYRIQQGPRRAVFTPLLQIGARAARWVGTFARLVTSGDAEQLARLLTADDVDYPVEKARAVQQRYSALAGTESARTVFRGFDEKTSTLRYEIEARRKDGTRVSVPVTLGYGDGLLWLREN